MYNNSVFLDDKQVTLFWTLSKTSISFDVQGEHKSSYIVFGLGSGMVNSFAYMGWVHGIGNGSVSLY